MQTSDSKHVMERDQCWRPIAYLAMQDASERQRLTSVLERGGWTVIAVPTGFHLVQSIADLIEGQSQWLRPGLIVVDAYSRGCAGATIAAGLRDLGIAIPIVLIAAPGQPLPMSFDRTVHVVSSGSAEAAVSELANRPTGEQRPAA